eukprot:CAMPEP_0205904806 /NCGR_PEP_ID=MMETSP1325-20131115/947_1 /ASSEMBLY_ACC=CAM_ASM_000708 /TAXON_ID=236786 /ORGANISM="Florenciella sp., Strain RCC1007" /LENGTH=1113 /DNA_ID=CAMNT_0053270633 /DNA_START=62 /DNA_END=3403 /DNA_ORIENTATION=+
MTINTLAGRSFNDLTQYPVFPWVLKDYRTKRPIDTSTDASLSHTGTKNATANPADAADETVGDGGVGTFELDLTDPTIYRDLSKPMGALNADRLTTFTNRYESFCDPYIPSFMYGSHYSTAAGVVMHYLMRLEPFASLHKELQGGSFDVPDRLFKSVEDSWTLNAEAGMEVKELTPEWYTTPEFLRNGNKFDLGVTQAGERVGDVVLPYWARSPEHFIATHRAALESEFVTNHLHEWIDLIFGHKQRGPAAVEANNVFYYLTYHGSVDLSAIEDREMRLATEMQIAHFGQCPMQLFLRPHPPRLRRGSVTSAPLGGTMPPSSSSKPLESSSSVPAAVSTPEPSFMPSLSPPPPPPPNSASASDPVDICEPLPPPPSANLAVDHGAETAEEGSRPRFETEYRYNKGLAGHLALFDPLLSNGTQAAGGGVIAGGDGGGGDGATLNTPDLIQLEPSAMLTSLRSRSSYASTAKSASSSVVAVRAGPGFVVSVDGEGMVEVAHWSLSDPSSTDTHDAGIIQEGLEKRQAAADAQAATDAEAAAVAKDPVACAQAAASARAKERVHALAARQAAMRRASVQEEATESMQHAQDEGCKRQFDGAGAGDLDNNHDFGVSGSGSAGAGPRLRSQSGVHLLMKRLEPPFNNAYGAPRVSSHGAKVDPFISNTNANAGGNGEDELSSVVAAISSSGQFVFSSVGDLGCLAIQEVELTSGLVERCVLLPAHDAPVCLIQTNGYEATPHQHPHGQHQHQHRAQDDEEIVLSGSTDGLVMLWRFQRRRGRKSQVSRRPWRVLRGHDAPVRCGAVCVELGVAVTCSESSAIVYALDGQAPSCAYTSRNVNTRHKHTGTSDGELPTLSHVHAHATAMHSGSHGAVVLRRLEIAFHNGGVDGGGGTKGVDGTGRHAYYSHCAISSLGFIALAMRVADDGDGGRMDSAVTSVVEVMNVNGTMLARAQVPGDVSSLAFVAHSHVLAVARADGHNGFIDMRNSLDLSLLWRYRPATHPAAAASNGNTNRLTCMSLCPSLDCPALIVTGDEAGTVRLQGLPGFVQYCRDMKVAHRNQIGKMVQGSARKVRKRLAARAMQAKDLAAEALDEAKVLVDEAKNLPLVKGIVGFFSR